MRLAGRKEFVKNHRLPICAFSVAIALLMYIIIRAGPPRCVRMASVPESCNISPSFRIQTGEQTDPTDGQKPEWWLHGGSVPFGPPDLQKPYQAKVLPCGNTLDGRWLYKGHSLACKTFSFSPKRHVEILRIPYCRRTWTYEKDLCIELEMQGCNGIMHTYTVQESLLIICTVIPR